MNFVLTDCQYNDSLAISHHKFFIDSDEVVYQRRNVGATSYQEFQTFKAFTSYRWFSRHKYRKTSYNISKNSKIASKVIFCYLNMQNFIPQLTGMVVVLIIFIYQA